MANNVEHDFKKNKFDKFAVVYIVIRFNTIISKIVPGPPWLALERGERRGGELGFSI